MNGEKIIEMVNVEKWYNQVKGTGPLNLEIYKGEFISFLGPSGCGKTTGLRIISGLIQPTSGTVSMAGKVIDDVPAHKRGIGMVFQNYALFPHLTIFENVAFGLKIKKFDKKEILEKVNNILDLMMLKDMDKRYPNELSGGQQQRVSLARSLVTNPHVLLLDEPLSNLDLKLREQMRLELIRIHKQFKITSVYVTHDQGEALSMSDRIVVMNEGLIVQVGTPREIYRYPKNRFVANFIGQSNFWEGESSSHGGKSCFVTKRGLKVIINDKDVLPESRKLLLIRPESIILDFNLNGDNVFKAKIEEMVYQGDSTQYHLLIEEKERLILVKRNEEGIARLINGMQVMCQINPADCFLLKD